MPEAIGTYKPKSTTSDRAPKGRPSQSARSKTLPADRILKSTNKEIRESLETALGMAILGLSAKGWDDDARILEEDGSELISQWLWLADRNPSVRRALEWLTGGGGYASFAMVNIGVVLGILQNHGKYPEDLPTPRAMKTMFTFMVPTDDATAETFTAPNPS